MPLLNETFESYTNNTEPTGITKWDGAVANAYTVKTTKPYAGSQGLLMTGAGNFHAGYYYTSALSSGDITYEGWFNPDGSVGDRFGLSFRVWDNSGTKQGYYATLRTGNSLRLGRFVGTTETVITTVTIPTLVTKIWYKIKAYMNGSTLKVKYWAEAFGNKNVEASTGQMSGNILGSVSTSYQAGKIASITAYLAPTGTTRKAKFALYKASDDSLVGQTQEITLNAGTGWYTATFTTPVDVLAATNYYIVGWADGSSQVTIARSALTNGGRLLTTAYAANFPNPSGTANNNFKYSIYATYTDVEPSAWDIDTTDTNNDNTKKGVGVYLYSGNSLNLYYADNLYAESLATNVTVTPAALDVTSQQQAPTAQAIRNVSVSVSALDVTSDDETPSIFSATNITNSPGVLDTYLALLNPSVSAIMSPLITPSPLDVTSNLQSPTVIIGDQIIADILDLTLSIPSPTIIAQRNITVAVATLEVTGELNTPTIAAQNNDYSNNDPYYVDIGGGLSAMLDKNKVPYWNTANRPSSPVKGMVGYNVTTESLEVYNGSAWFKIDLVAV